LPRQPTKKDGIVEELRSMIASGEIARGARIRQSELAERFASSVTPVREALQQLQAEGVVVGEPHRGLRVAEADLDAIRGAYVVRRLVEPYAAQRASLRITRRELDALDALIERMAQAHATGDGAAASDANRAFHFGIYARCGLPALTRRIEDLWLAYPWDILHVLRDPAGLIVEHRAMAAAVRDADLPRIAETVSAHIAGGYRELVLHLDDRAGDDPFDLDAD
jgi:DNA-binding GntR family transcriptional regulator